MFAPIEMPLFVGVMAVAAAIAAYYVIKLKDMIYASISLALLGSLTAALIALAGFPIVAAYLVLVYVGAAVMFLIITISMLGLRGSEERDTFRGIIAAAAVFTLVIAIAFSSKLYNFYVLPYSVSAQQAASRLLSRYLLVLALIFVGQATTIVEAISIARRGGRS